MARMLTATWQGVQCGHRSDLLHHPLPATTERTELRPLLRLFKMSTGLAGELALATNHCFTFLGERRSCTDPILRPVVRDAGQLGPPPVTACSWDVKLLKVWRSKGHKILSNICLEAGGQGKRLSWTAR